MYLAAFYEFLTTSASMKMSFVLYTLARQGFILGAFRTASFALEQLQANYKVPREWQSNLERLQVQLFDKSPMDNEDVLPTCYCCSQSNPVLSPAGNRCVSCNSPFVPSFYGFDNLPLVEFQLDPSITLEEVQKILDGVLLVSGIDSLRKSLNDENDETSNTMSFETDEEDPFTAQAAGLISAHHGMVTVNRLQLSKLKKSEIFIIPKALTVTESDMKRPAVQVRRFFRHIVPEIQVVLCHDCHHFFHADDYEFAVLQSKACPYCRAPIQLS